MKVSGLELEIQLKLSEKNLNILIISDIPTNCCDIKAIDVDKYLINKLESHENPNLFYVPNFFNRNSAICNNQIYYLDKIDSVFKLIIHDKSFSNKNLFNIDIKIDINLEFNMNIDTFLKINMNEITESLVTDIKNLNNLKKEITNNSGDFFGMLFIHDKEPLVKFMKESKNQIFDHLENLVKYTNNMIEICQKFIETRKNHVSFVKGPEFGNVQIYHYNIRFVTSLAKNFTDLLTIRNESYKTLQVFLQTLEFLVLIHSKKFENNLIVSSEQFSFNILHILVNNFDASIEYISDKYDVNDTLRKLKSLNRNDIYDIFIKNPKSLGCTTIEI